MILGDLGLPEIGLRVILSETETRSRLNYGRLVGRVGVRTGSAPRPPPIPR